MILRVIYLYKKDSWCYVSQTDKHGHYNSEYVQTYRFPHFGRTTRDFTNCHIEFERHHLYIFYGADDRLIINRLLLCDVYWIGNNGERIECGDEFGEQ